MSTSTPFLNISADETQPNPAVKRKPENSEDVEEFKDLNRHKVVKANPTFKRKPENSDVEELNRHKVVKTNPTFKSKKSKNLKYGDHEMIPFQFESLIDLQSESILGLFSNEILVLILSCLNLVDLDSFGRTCKKFYNVFTFFLTQPIAFDQLSNLDPSQYWVVEKRKSIWIKVNEIPTSSPDFLAKIKVSINGVSFMNCDCYFDLISICMTKLTQTPFSVETMRRKVVPLNIVTSTPMTLSLAWLSISVLKYYIMFELKWGIDPKDISLFEDGHKKSEAELLTFVAHVNGFENSKDMIETIEKRFKKMITINGRPFKKNQFLDYETFAKEMDKVNPSEIFVKTINQLKSVEFFKCLDFTGRSHLVCYNYSCFVLLRYIMKRFNINQSYYHY